VTLHAGTAWKAINRITLDGRRQTGDTLAPQDDAKEHNAEVHFD